ncbi:MAG: hypothetical protein US96_C0044G0002 [Candidatus Woesebacteria bacterium GW2011_GWB1_38_5b]|uniref:Uncharacterized protein n=1 Tax=Candidatus Woesebacteria bacterium GW2011_GWB1_38_5b TaxID=1618569 RepID=A0A0G0K2Q3_9BACT|nr:MAG: hypothetical protein US96_C0044G0002 [Candidatus Woesebacteria bacterium GW2011_GWB1_38_5b]OGH48321.1 MAG: hypothetical protein A3A51_00815 [Candidatus Levybacteria bacterium RIFCSPLOWO2_01_FULL_39_10]
MSHPEFTPVQLDGPKNVMGYPEISIQGAPPGDFSRILRRQQVTDIDKKVSRGTARASRTQVRKR